MAAKDQQKRIFDQVEVLRDLRVVGDVQIDGTLTAGGGGTVTSIFGRTGAVAAAGGDYDASQITVTPVGALSATQAQAAFQELDADLSALISALASTMNGAGASLIGVEDSGGLISGGNAEAALAELAAVTTQINAGDNVLVSPPSGVTFSNELVPFRRFRLSLVNIDVSIDAADDFGSFQIATLPSGVLLFLCSRVNLTVTDQGNLGTLADVDMALGTVAVAANDMSTSGCQSLLGTIDATAGGVFQEIQPQGATNSNGFSNPVYLNVTQMVTSNATARFNGSIELLYVDLKATDDT